MQVFNLYLTLRCFSVEKRMSSKNTKNKPLSSYKQKDKLLVFGYIREYHQIISIPTELRELCFNFYHSPYTICKFSKIYQSEDAFEMLDDDKCVKRIVREGNHYILADTDPVWQEAIAGELKYIIPKEDGQFMVFLIKKN